MKPSLPLLLLLLLVYSLSILSICVVASRIAAGVEHKSLPLNDLDVFSDSLSHDDANSLIQASTTSSLSSLSATRKGKPKNEILAIQNRPAQQLLPGIDYAAAGKFTPRSCNNDPVCDASNKFQQKLYAQQYPDQAQCNSPDRKFLLCYPIRKQGFGSTFHHMMWCMTLGVATGRTVIFVSKNGVFNKADDCPDEALRKTWECYFQPVSSCAEPDDDRAKRVMWKAGRTERSDAKTIVVDMIWGLDKYKDWAPDDVKQALSGASHINPGLWVKGQIAEFLNRFHPRMQNEVEEFRKKIGFKNPIGCVHIRRTDKVVGKSKEADAFTLESYMTALEDLMAGKTPDKSKVQKMPGMSGSKRGQKAQSSSTTFSANQSPSLLLKPFDSDIRPSYAPSPLGAPNHHRRRGNADGGAVLGVKGDGGKSDDVVVLQASLLETDAQSESQQDKPRVFVATEDPGVIEETKKKYGNKFNLIFNEDGPEADKNEKERYNYRGMMQMLLDVEVLSHCDWFVGTDSSNLSRWTEERMYYQLNSKAPSAVFSLDKEWYYEL